MEKYGKWSEQESTKFRTSTDNKELTVTPPASLTGASLTLTLPNVSGTTDNLVSRTSTDTLTNKTLTAPVISSIVNTGTLTLPTSTDTLVGRATTDTLTNKTIDGDDNTVQDLALTTLKTTANTNVFIQRNGSGVVIDSAKAVPSGDVVGTSDAQTLTNKTIDGDNNTVQDLALTALKTTANTSVFLQRNGSGVVIDSAKAVPSGDVVGTSDTQTLSNKTISDFLFDDANVSISTNSIAVGTATILRITAGTGPLNTMTGGADGDVKILVNELGSRLTIDDNNGANGFISGAGVDTLLEDDASIMVVYNSTSSRWQIVSESPMDHAVTTQGDIVLGDANGKAVRLAIGASGTVLTSNGTTAAWSTPAGTGDVTAAANIADNRLVRGDGGAKGIQQSGITVDDSNNLTGIGTIGSGAITSTGAVQGTSVTDGTASLSSGDLSALDHVFGGLNAAADPTYSFTGDTNTGIYSSGADTLNISTGGTERVRVNSSGQILGVAGSAAAPTFSFIGDPDTGIYGTGSGDTRFSANGTLRTIHDGNGKWLGVDGAATAPTWSFQNDSDIGMYRAAANQLAFSSGNSSQSAISQANNNWDWYNSAGTNRIRFDVASDTALKTGTTAWGTLSDSRIKTNIRPINNALGKMLALNPTHFEYINSGVNKHRPGTTTGFIAQEFEQVLPGHVKEIDNPLVEADKSLVPAGEKIKIIEADLIPYLVKAIQELKEENNQLSARISALEGV